jgi:hypothetical protein
MPWPGRLVARLPTPQALYVKLIAARLAGLAALLALGIAYFLA